MLIHAQDDVECYSSSNPSPNPWEVLILVLIEIRALAISCTWTRVLMIKLLAPIGERGACACEKEWSGAQRSGTIC